MTLTLLQEVTGEDVQGAIRATMSMWSASGQWKVAVISFQKINDLHGLIYVLKVKRQDVTPVHEHTHTHVKVDQYSTEADTAKKTAKKKNPLNTKSVGNREMPRL